MKNLFSTLIAGAIIVGCFWAYDYNQKMAQTWQAEAQYKLQQKIREDERNQAARYARAQWWANHTNEVYTGVALLVVSSVVFAGWHAYDRRREAHNRAVDGMFALREVGRGVQKQLINPNIQTAPSLALNGNQTSEYPAQAEWMLQDKALTNQGKVQHAQAMKELGLPRTAAGGKYLAGAYDRPPIKPAEWYVAEEDVPMLEAEFERLSLVDAFNQSTEDNWILGQSPDDGGLCEFNIFDTVHTGLVGATKTGKTSSTALLEMANAVKNKWHVVALDAKQGVDWMPYEKHIEAIDCDYTVLPNYVQAIEDVHRTRMLEVKRNGVSNIDEIKGVRYPNTLIILEEFGYMMQALKSNNPKLHKTTESTLSNLMRVSRASGIYFLLIDQNPSKWPSTVVANIKSYFAYKISGKVGSAINEYHLDDLAKVGQFSYESTKYDAWYTKGEINKLLRPLPERKFKLLKPVEPVIDEVVYDDEIDGEYTLEKTSYSTSYQSDNSGLGGSQVVTSGSGVTTLQERVTTAITSKKPLLQGEPVTQEDKKLVYDVLQITGSKNKAYEALWGGKNGKRQGWLSAVIEEMEAISV